MTFPRLAGALAVLALTLVPGASAQTTYPPCPAGTAAPTFTVNGKAMPVYTTHDLLVRVKLPGDPNFFRRELRRFRSPRIDARERGGATRAWCARSATRPARSRQTQHSKPPTPRGGNPCTVSGSATIEVEKQADPPAVSKLRRPRVYKPDPRLSWDSDFRFTVKPGPTGDRRPLTVEDEGPRDPTRKGAGSAREARHADVHHAALGRCHRAKARRNACWGRAAPRHWSARRRSPRGRRVQRSTSSIGVDAWLPAAVEVEVTLPRGYPGIAAQPPRSSQPRRSGRQGAPGRAHDRPAADRGTLRRLRSVLALPLQEAHHGSVEPKGCL